MEADKLDLLRTHFEQIESQVQFGDTKASLLIAGDSILLAISGGLMKLSSGCKGDEFAVGCIAPTAFFGLAVTAAALLIGSLGYALVAIRPASIHRQPPPELFLVSYVALFERQDFLNTYAKASAEYLITHMLYAIHSKARFATKKFFLLRRAIDYTIASLSFMVATAVMAAVNVLQK